MPQTVAIALILLMFPPSPASAPETETDERRLAKSLVHLSALAGRYADAALGFTCDETIRHYTHGGREDYRFQYFYRRYDDGSLDDYRRAMLKRGPQTLAETRLPSVLRRPYSWVFIFDRHHARHHDYESAGTMTIRGRAAQGVRAVPRPPYVRDVNEWFATAWIDEETGELLRVEAIHVEDHPFREAYRESLRKPSGRSGTYTFEETVTDFDVTGRDLSLPSEARLLKVTYGATGDKPWREHLVRQIYRHYRFFSVHARAPGDPPSRQPARAAEPAVPTLSDLDLPIMAPERPTAERDEAIEPAAPSPPEPELAVAAPAAEPPIRELPVTPEIARPAATTILAGPSEIHWSATGPDAGAEEIEYRVYLEPYPAPLCRVHKPPFVCRFDAGDGLQSRAIRVEAWSGARQLGSDRVTTRAFPRPEPVERFTLRASAVVTDPSPDWDPTDLECSYGGQPCRVVSGLPLAEQPSLPVSLEILVDTSLSVRPDRYQLLEAVRRLIDEAPGAVAISVAEFATHYMRLGDFTRDRQEAEQAVNHISAGLGSSSCLYNAMRRSLAGLATRPGHRLLFVLSDGGDNCNGQASMLVAMDRLAHVAMLSRETATPIYVYALRQSTAIQAFGGTGTPEQVVNATKNGLEQHARLFEGLASETGGFAVSRHEFTSLSAAFDRLLGDLHSTWTLDIDVDESVAEGPHRLILASPANPGAVRHPLYLAAGGHEESLIAMLESPDPDDRRFAVDRLDDHASLAVVEALGRALDIESVDSLREAERRAWVRGMAVLLVHGSERDRRKTVRLLERGNTPDATREPLVPFVDLALRLPALDARDADRLREWLGARNP